MFYVCNIYVYNNDNNNNKPEKSTLVFSAGKTLLNIMFDFIMDHKCLWI